MAITYKSQGGGVSTETSGAALSPLCPATAPSPPGDWTILGSSPYVIETTIARHWVYGKIAAGTEDGAAVACGSPAVTTQRGARIYSFAGRVAGTITELVTGFAHLSHATDPAMPTVTTTLAGALAVALVAQNDNNTFGNPTGESGGDWVEALATEFSANLTPGFSMGICSATPTGNPGTISGGTIATTNDPVGVIGFQIKESNNQVAVTTPGDLTVTGFAPVVSVTNHINITPSFGELVVTGFAPAITTSNNISITPSVGELVVEGFAPVVNIGTNTITSTGEIIIEGFAPVVTISNHINITPSFGEIVVTGFAPTVNISDHQNIITSLGEIIVTGFTPTVTTSDHINILTSRGELTVEGFAPTVSISNNISVTPGFGELIVTGFAPTVSTESGVTAETQTGELIITGFAPTVVTTDNVMVVTRLGELVITGYAPIVSTANNEFLNIGSPIENPSLSSEISEIATHSTITRLRRKSKMENGI